MLKLLLALIYQFLPNYAVTALKLGNVFCIFTVKGILSYLDTLIDTSTVKFY